MQTERKRPLFVILFVAGLFIIGIVITVQAQVEPAGITNAATQAGTGFTFQGQLQDNDSPRSL